MGPKKPATTMIALFLLALPMTVQADDDSAYTLAAYSAEGVTQSVWCVTYGLVLQGCNLSYGAGSASIVCYQSSCSVEDFTVTETLGTVKCVGGGAASNMIVEGAGKGDCGSNFVNHSLGICDIDLWATTEQPATGKIFEISIRLDGACVGIEV